MIREVQGLSGGRCAPSLRRSDSWLRLLESWAFPSILVLGLRFPETVKTGYFTMSIAFVSDAIGGTGGRAIVNLASRSLSL